MNKSKKLNLIIALLVSALCLLPATPTQAATKVYTIKAKVTYKIFKGEKIKLYVKKYKKSKKVKWKSSKKRVATVSKKGVVTGKRCGTTTITATIGKKKFKTKVQVWSAKEKVVYNNDISKGSKTDNHNSDELTLEKEKIVYDEWVTKAKLKECGLDVSQLGGTTNQILISSQAGQGITGSSSYVITDVPTAPEVGTIYGSELRYQYNGTEFLFNTNDLIKLNLLPQYKDVYVINE